MEQILEAIPGMAPDRPRQAVILAGGRGTRLRPITDTIPKARVPFHGKPFVGHVVDVLREQGFEKVLMLLGYLADNIVEHFGDGSGYGIEVEYDVTAPDDLTAYRVQHAQDRLEDLFMLLYCDNYWPMRFDAMWRDYVDSGADAQITVYSNEDGYSRDSVIVGRDGFVEVFDRSRVTPGLRGVEIGYAILQRDVVLPLLPTHQILFEEAVYPTLARRGELYAHWTRHRYYSVGDHERLPLTEAFFARRPTVILDRDGVLNEKPPRAEYVRRPEDFIWLPGARDALAMFAEAGWRVVIISNQAGIARDVMTAADLEAVHQHMCGETEAAGGHIERIYVCPHGWDEACDCRKPSPGLLFQAQRDLHLDLTRTFFIGDDERDLEAARAAGCPAALVSPGSSLLDVSRRLLDGTLESQTETVG
jgi:D-glycero-D-manno-heptose 1,7-bisphosphate phosphatase